MRFQPRSAWPRLCLKSAPSRGDRPVVLGVETIFARDQHIVDEWWRREIDEEELTPAYPLRSRLGIRLGAVLRIAGHRSRACRRYLRAGLHAA